MTRERKIFKFKKILGFLFVLMAWMMCCTYSSFALGNIDGNADISMTLQYNGKKGPVTNASFHVYHVANVLESGAYEITEAFQNAPIAFEGLTNDGWQQLATTLKSYVWDKKITKLDTGKTDQDGKLTFPSEGISMKPGLYLVLGDTKSKGAYTYYATPFLICLPGLDENGLQNAYHMDVTPKYRWDYDDPDDSDPKSSKLIRKVLKVWRDEDHEQYRPESVTVQLLRDGAIYDTAVLHKGNNWRYTWSDLDKGYDWMIVEENAGKYSVNITQEGITFVVTNTYNPSVPNEPPTPDTPNGITEEPPEPELFVLSDQDIPLASLPQTGQLWWPVPILVCLGFVCMIISAISRRSAYEE